MSYDKFLRIKTKLEAEIDNRIQAYLKDITELSSDLMNTDFFTTELPYLNPEDIEGTFKVEKYPDLMKSIDMRLESATPEEKAILIQRLNEFWGELINRGEFK